MGYWLRIIRSILRIYCYRPSHGLAAAGRTLRLSDRECHAAATVRLALRQRVLLGTVLVLSLAAHGDSEPGLIYGLLVAYNTAYIRKHK